MDTPLQKVKKAKQETLRTRLRPRNISIDTGYMRAWCHRSALKWTSAR